MIDDRPAEALDDDGTPPGAPDDGQPAATDSGLRFLRDDDAAAIRELATTSEVVRVHPNESHWWNHGSFALPLLGSVLCLVIGFAVGIAELIGFGVFLAAAALFMVPVVLVTWRQTATVIVLTADAAWALHGGRALRTIPWAEVRAIERFDTLGNIRWKIFPHAGDHLTIDGEIADAATLVFAAHDLAGLPRPDRYR